MSANSLLNGLQPIHVKITQDGFYEIPQQVSGTAPLCVSYEIAYKWRRAQADSWLIDMPWGKFPIDRDGLARFGEFSGKTEAEFISENGIDLAKPDIKAVTGFGAPFYAELYIDDSLCDAYSLGDSEDLGEADASDLGFFGKTTVKLYADDKQGSIKIRLRTGADSGYDGDIWLGGITAAGCTESEFPPEYITSKYPAKPKPVIENAAVKPADSEAHAEAKNLLAYLAGAAKAGYMLYGVQNYPYSKGGMNFPGAGHDTSDIFDLTGARPAIFGLDSLSLIGMENAFAFGKFQVSESEKPDHVNIPKYIEGSAKRVIDEWKHGVIPTLSMHMSDPAMVYDDYIAGNKNRATGKPIYNETQKYPWSFYGYGYDNSCRTARDEKDGRERSPHKPMLAIYNALSGTGAERENAVLSVFNAYLDIVADFCFALQAESVPVLLRPFHESSGDWFWWGPSGCENGDGSYNPDIFIRNWQHIVQYLTERGVHNALYVYSPNGSDFDNMGKIGTGEFRPYAVTYPSDSFVDVTAFDDYSTDKATLQSDIDTVSKFAAEHNKVFAASEVTGSPNDHGVNDLVFGALADTSAYPANIAYMLQWTPPSFSPYLTSQTRGNSAAVNGFIEILSLENIVLS